MTEDPSLDPQKLCTEKDVVGAPVCPSNNNMEGGDKQTHRVHRRTILAYIVKLQPSGRSFPKQKGKGSEDEQTVQATPPTTNTVSKQQINERIN